ncbi:MAG TPA: aquaporin [Chitinophagaceae bacterium]|nr:aquaporin [Chitinophagaceae bacterium]
MPIRVIYAGSGVHQARASFLKNRKHYLQEALGLAIFMISACFFGAMLEGRGAWLHHAIPVASARLVLMGVLMGLTALFIFYSPFTSPSGSHINPAVTLTFLRLGKMCPWDTAFYIIFQFAGGLAAVYIMQWVIGGPLVNAPVRSVVTVPGKAGLWPAFCTEFIIAVIMMCMVLFSSRSRQWQKYTRIIAACLVCVYVITAGPVSGFGMNPARTFASALPSHTWTAIWIYMLAPVAGMLCAAEIYLLVINKKENTRI